jgi:hypothetical protein
VSEPIRSTPGSSRDEDNAAQDQYCGENRSSREALAEDVAAFREPLWRLLNTTMDHQERMYGMFKNDVAGMRLGLAVAADELAETLQAWRDERREDGWPETHVELMQLAAIACRLLMDSGLPEGSIAWPSSSVTYRPDAISGEPEFVSRQALAEAADAFVAAMGSRNRMMFSSNLRNVASNSDAMLELHAALGRAYVPER